MYEWVKSFSESSSSKRFEDTVNFIFRLTFRKLKNDPPSARQVFSFAKNKKDDFFEYYFGELAKEKGIPLSSFDNPLNYKNKGKCLDKNYMKLVFSSSRFKKNFLEYFRRGELIKDYQFSLPKKLMKIMERFEAYFTSYDINVLDKNLTKLQKYFRTNKQLKLPWTQKEIKMSIKNFEIFLEGLN